MRSRSPRSPQSGNLSWRLPSRRLAAPAKGNGRLQVQVRRCFIAHGPTISASTIYDWAYARGQVRRYYAVYRILREIAEQVGRAPTTGRPWLWRLKAPETIESVLPGAYRTKRQ